MLRKNEPRDYSRRAQLARKKNILGTKIHGARKVILTPRLRKKNISGKTKQGKKCKKKSGSGD